MTEPLLHKEITDAVIRAYYDVYNSLGVGFLESVYLKAVVLALVEKGLKVQAQAPLTVKFRGHVVGEFYADLLVEGRVIVELKVARSLAAEHESQLINYLRATGIRVGLLVNFGKARLEWKRLVC